MKNNVGGITFPNFKTKHKGTEIKTAWYWNKDIYRNPQKRNNSLDVNTQIYN